MAARWTAPCSTPSIRSDAAPTDATDPLQFHSADGLRVPDVHPGLHCQRRQWQPGGQHPVLHPLSDRTLPLLTPLILFNFILQMVYAFQTFTPAFIVSGGNGSPVDSTLFYTLYQIGRCPY